VQTRPGEAHSAAPSGSTVVYGHACVNDARFPDLTRSETPPGLLDVLIVGSGFSGLCLALQLQRAGRRWHLVEQASRLGGTWRDNHYPGAACDIPSNLYSLSFLPNPDWTRLYPPQAEIEAYMNRCADAGGIRHGLQFEARVMRAAWDETGACWQVTLAGGDTIRCRTLALGTGGLSRPQLPQIEGLERFGGEVFHSARWRHEVALAGRRVGVIGTGASGIQIVPAIAPECGSLTLFQRTPAWIIPRHDRAVDAATRALYRRRPWRQRLDRAVTYARLESRAFAFTRATGLLRHAERHVRKYLGARVRDPALRRRLTPDYTLGCKRILLSDDFYAALQRPNVTLVDQGVVRATAGGVVTADGREHPLDVLVAATGFQVADAGAPFEVIGRDGADLNRIWAGGPQAYLGTTVAGFPNLFLMTGPNTGLGHNSMVYVIESQVRFVVAALEALERRGATAFDVKAPVQARFNATLQQRLAGTVWNTGGCRSWYLAADGSNRTLWPDYTFVLRRRLSRFDWQDFHATGVHP
jgi:cation diffusion facilitator CzcD-associated flavoprotein CzcO